MSQASRSEGTPSRFHRPAWGAVAVALLAILVYLNSLGNDFALDDVPIIRDNVEVHGLAAIPEAISGSYWPAILTPSAYRPLTLATYAVDWEIWGRQAAGFHLANILLHAAASVLVFLLLGQLGLGLAAATAGAAVFAVHPVHVEAVANIVGRAEILAALFFVAAAFVYLRKRPGWVPAALIAALYFLSLASKEMGATLPAVLLLLEAYRAQSLREAVARALDRWRTYLLVTVTFVGYMALRAVNLRSLIGDPGPAWFTDAAPWAHVWTAIRVVPEYLRLMLWPAKLVADYGPATIVPEPTPFASLVIVGFLTAAMLAAVAYVTWGRARSVALGILWFAVTILPVSGLLFPAGVILAERTLYLPSVGLAVVVAALVAWVRSERPAFQRPLALALALAVLAGGVRTWIHNPVWRSTRSVLVHLAATHPTNYRAQWWFADQLYDEGEVEASLDHLQLALRMVPDYFNIRLVYGERLVDAGLYHRAEAQFDTARQLMPTSDQAHAHYLGALILQGDVERALTTSDSLLQRFPHSAQLWTERTRALARAGDHQAARAASNRTIQLLHPQQRWRHMLVHAAIALALADTAAARSAHQLARTAAPEKTTLPSLEEMTERLRSGKRPFEGW